MCPTLIVKNTFICAVDAEALSPPPRKRARTMGDVASLVELDAELPHDLSGAAAAGPPMFPWAEHVGVPALAIEVGGTEAAEAVAEVRDSALDLAFDASGCKLVLQALELASTNEVRFFAARLRGLVPEVARSPHAHQVLLELIHRLGTADAAFIAEELLGQASALARNAHGSTVFCRLLEYSGDEAQTVALVDELLADDVATLCCHKFGYHVAMSVLSNGLARQRSLIVAALTGDLHRLARHRFATQVLELAFVHGSAEECRDLASGLMAKAGAVQALACHGFGVHIVRAILQLPGEGARAREFLLKGSSRVLKDRYGAQLLKELGLAGQAAAAAAGGA